jgi:hypothetical protein
MSADFPKRSIAAAKVYLISCARQHRPLCRKMWIKSKRVNGIQGAPQRVIVQHLGGDARPQQALVRP